MINKILRISFFLLLSAPAFAFLGGQTKPHNHTSSAGDGGLLSNLALQGNGLTYPDGSLQPTANPLAPSPILNPGFESWQLGTSFSTPADTTFIADGWQIQTSNGVGASYTVSKDTTIFDTGSASLKFVVVSTGTGGSNSLRVYQNLENFTDFVGSTVTVSVRLKTTLANSVRFVIDPAINPPSWSSYHSGSGNWETLIATMTLQSNDTFFIIKIGQTTADEKPGTWWVDSVSFNYGLITSTSAVKYVPPDPALDRARIARYHQFGGSVNGPIYIYSWGSSDGTNYCLGAPVAFNPPMVSTPTVTLTINHITEDGSSTDVQGSYTVSGIQVTPNGFVPRACKAVAGNRPGSFSFYWKATAANNPGF